MCIRRSGSPLRRLAVTAVLAVTSIGVWADSLPSGVDRSQSAGYAAKANWGIQQGGNGSRRRHYVPVDEVTTTPASVAVEVGARTQLKATVRPDDASNKHVFRRFENGDGHALDSGSTENVLAEGDDFEKVTTPITDTSSHVYALRASSSSDGACRSALGRSCEPNQVSPASSSGSFPQDAGALNAFGSVPQDAIVTL